MATLQGSESGSLRAMSNIIGAKVVTDKGVEIVKARFLWAPPRIRNFCEAGAVKHLRTIWGNDEIPEKQIRNEVALLVISYVLRRAEDLDVQVYPWPANCFNSKTGQWNTDALRDAEIRDKCPNLDDLWQDYAIFEAAEFPDEYTDEQYRGLLDDAKKLTVETFLCKHGFLPTLRALPGLGRAFPASLNTNGSAGRL